MRGSATNRRPHARHRKLGTPLWVGPLRTTWPAAHRGHGGIEAGSAVSWLIPSGYDRADKRATTQFRVWVGCIGQVSASGSPSNVAG